MAIQISWTRSSTCAGEDSIILRVNRSRCGPCISNNSPNAASSPIWLRSTSICSYSCCVVADTCASGIKLRGASKKFNHGQLFYPPPESIGWPIFTILALRLVLRSKRRRKLWRRRSAFRFFRLSAFLELSFHPVGFFARPRVENSSF